MTNSVDEIQFSMEVLVQVLEGFLSPDENNTEEAELKLQELRWKVPDEFGIHLAKCVTGNESSTPVRKLASNILKQYVDGLWKPKWRCPEIELETKKTISELLLSGLCESDSEMRNLVVDLIDTIARSGWSNNWPNVFDTLVENLHSENKFAFLGSMEVISLFSTRLTEARLTDVGPVILRGMYTIFENADMFSVQARSQAVQIFSRIVSFVISGVRERTDLVEQVLDPSIKLFCSKFSEILRVRNGVETETEIKYRMIDVINNLTRNLPQSISTFLPEMLPLIWETLIECAKVYREHVINVSGGIQDNGVRVYEGVPAHFQDLVLAILHLIGSLMESYVSRLRDSIPTAEYLKLQNSLRPEILEHLVTLMEITDEQIESWTENPKRFIDDESLAMSSNGTLQFGAIRCEARVALNSILQQEINDCPEIPDKVNATCDLIDKLIAAGNEMRSSTDSEVKRNWWKLHEASIQVFGAIANVFTNQKITRDFKFDVEDFLENVVLVDLDDPEVHPLLLGSCLYVSESYIEQMSLDLRLAFLKSTINCLRNRPTCTRVRAARVARCWIRSVLDQGKNDETENILKAQLPTLIEAIFNLGTQLMSAEVLWVVLGNFAELASRGEEFTALVEGSICTLAIAAFLQYRSDGWIILHCQTIFSRLTQNPACSGLLQARLVPILIARLVADPKEVSTDVFGVLETLQILVEKSPQPLSSILIENAFPALCRFILGFEEHTEYFLDRACNVLDSYLSVGAQLVIDYRDNDGKNGLRYILQIVDHLFGAATANDRNLYKAVNVLTKLIATGTMVGNNMKRLLKAVLGYTQRPKRVDKSCHTMAHDQPVEQALWVVWARLFDKEFDAVFEFLSAAQGPDGQNALAIVISNVFCNALNSLSPQDGYRAALRTALCKIADYGMLHRDSTLHKIKLHETKAGAKKAVPILAIILELVAHDLRALHQVLIF